MEQTPAPEVASLGDLMMNVFTSPAEAFDGVRTGPPRASVWVIPFLLTILLASVFAYVMFSNDTLRDQAMEPQRKAMQERVDSGQMTQEQADNASEQMSGGSMMMIFGVIGSAIFISIAFFGAALVLWLAGKFVLKAPGGYGKYLEVYGLSGWIGILGLLVTILMVVAMNSLYATPSLGLAVVDEYDTTNKMHLIMSSINVFGIWQAVVIGIGLSKLADKPAGTGITVAMVLWVLWVACAVALGFAR